MREYKIFLKLEKALSENSVSAYIADIQKLQQYLEIHGLTHLPSDIAYEDLQDFLKWITDLGLSSRTQARII